MLPDNPLQLALQQLAKTMGVALPSTEGLVATLSTSDKQKSQPRASANEETEEGELSESESASQRPPKIAKKSPKKLVAKGGSKTKKTFCKDTVSKSPARKGRAQEAAPQKTVEPKPKVPCRYWMEGKCSKGDECTFSHALRPNKTVEEAKSEEVCRFHIAGNCLKGDGCMYSHDLSKVPCKFFHVKNECSAGDKCRFSHAPVSEDLRRQLFAEMMGSRDPRLAPSDEPPKVLSSKTCTLKARTFPPAMVPPNFFLDPEVAKYNPFGSPF